MAGARVHVQRRGRGRCLLTIARCCLVLLLGTTNGVHCRAEPVSFAIAEIPVEESQAFARPLEFALTAHHFELALEPFEPSGSSQPAIEWYEPPDPSMSEMKSQSMFRLIGRDYASFYQPDLLFRLGAGFGLGAVMANTGIDRDLQGHFQRSVRGASSDDWFEYFHASKEMGNPMYAIPIVISAYAAGELFPNQAALGMAGDWGGRSFRGYLVGIPHALAFQLLTGGSRPGEQSYGSRWRTFADDNGVSGHSFVASLPFITAAKMTDRPLLKGGFYAASLLGPISRVNDDAHYTSQAFLGWWVAFAAASAVERTDNESRAWRLSPYVDEHSTGMAAEIRW